MPEDLHEKVGNLVRKTDELLWRCYHAAVRGGSVSAEAHALVFPKDANGVVRVSEQEAKQLLIDQLPRSPFLYSVETPTIRNYSFTGRGKRSAATDLTLYTTPRERFLNIEFKAHGYSLERRELGPITKDLKKLVLEPFNGYWFHTLENIDANTIRLLWCLFRKKLQETTCQAAGDFTEKTLTFHCCVLREQFSLQTTLPLEPGCCRVGWLEDLNPPELLLREGRLLPVTEVAGWTVHLPQQDRGVVPAEGR